MRRAAPPVENSGNSVFYDFPIKQLLIGELAADRDSLQRGSSIFCNRESVEPPEG